MHFQIIAKEVVQRFLPRIVGRVFEELLAEVLRETNDIKQMAVAITRQRRDSHARQHFTQARMDGHAGLFCATRLKGLHKFVSEVGPHCARTGCYKKRDMMRVKNLRRFHNQRHIPQSLSHHRLPHRRRRQQRR